MILTLLCALYALPGPYQFQLQNGTYQLYSINRRLCPEFDPQRDTIFELYTRKNPTNPQILLTGNENSIRSSNFDFTKPTIIFFHGFLESSKSDNSIQIRDSYLKYGDFNVILGNNERLLAGPDYLTAALNVLPIGKYSAKFLDYLVSLGMDRKSLHIIGMSLGGQVAGLTGKHMENKARRVTGLDPAGPWFSLQSQDQRIGPDDGEFVDVLHTNAGVNGINIPSGKVDVWFNGGSSQPGCSFKEILERNPTSVSEQVFCNHYQAYRVYVKSILEPKIYKLTKCTSYEAYQNGNCDSNDTTYLGEEMDETARGNYYITTGVTAVEI
ncbi:unnamed protein product [Phyllotreta striolata]|uniref:Lipase domain-containing protein n=1 Tax=Phyllotreta striolata TaxID=444603 RepID=A0A9N9TIK3_PHYSR|nr:unnamed protein product [Phyllotreta striolata]